MYFKIYFLIKKIYIKQIKRKRAYLNIMYSIFMRKNVEKLFNSYNYSVKGREEILIPHQGRKKRNNSNKKCGPI